MEGSSYALDNSSQFFAVMVQRIDLSNTIDDNPNPTPDFNFLAYLDDGWPELVLPTEVCDLFEKYFGIVYEPSLEQYYINDTQHEKLLAANVSISFVLASSFNTNWTTNNITIPYSDMSLEAPYRNITRRYFPLRRRNETLPLLGMAFLRRLLVFLPNFRTGAQLMTGQQIYNCRL